MLKSLLLLCALFSQTAQARLYEIIREHSKIGFEIDYMVMSTVDGRFKVFRGFFEYDENRKEISKVNMEINSDSIDTNDQKRDFHLKGQEFLFSDAHRYITFTSPKTVKIAADNTFLLPGTLTLRGISKSVILKGVLKGKRKDSWGKDSTFFVFNTNINRKDFKMTWNKVIDGGGYLVGDEVRISLTMQTQFTGDKTPFSTHMVPMTKGIIERDLLRRGKIKKLSTSTDPKDHAIQKDN